MKRLLTVLLVTLCLSVAGPRSADGHAQLRASAPASGALLDTGPDQVRLFFNEPVGLLQLRWLQPSGTVAAPEASVNGPAIIVVPPPRLVPGTHALVWRVVSADGHPVGGTLLFSIGYRSQAPQDETGSAGAIAAAAGRWMLILLLVFGSGANAWAALSGRAPPDRRRAIAGATTGCVAFMLAGQAMDLAGCGLLGLLARHPWELVAGSPFMWTAVLAIVAVGIPLAAPRGLAAAAASMLAAALSFAASGHAATAEPRPFVAIAVAIHAAAMLFWLGALPDLLRSTRDIVDVSIYQRFARVATPAVLALAISGTALAAAQLTSPHALIDTPYGLVLSAKLVLVVLLLSLAATNRLVLVPAMARGSMTARFGLRRSICVEIVLGAAILALAAGFRLTLPPRASLGVHGHFHGEHVMADISMFPGKAGVNRIEARIVDIRGETVVPLEIGMAASSGRDGLGPIEIRLAPPRGPDAPWTGVIVLPKAGIWELEVGILVDDFTKETLATDVELR